MQNNDDRFQQRMATAMGNDGHDPMVDNCLGHQSTTTTTTMGSDEPRVVVVDSLRVLEDRYPNSGLGINDDHSK